MPDPADLPGMSQTAPSAKAPRPSLLTAEDYLDLLHPAEGHGRPVLLVEGAGGRRRARTLDRETARLALPGCLDTTAFLSLNRFRATYRSDQLAALNALYVDLDWHKLAPLRGQSPDQIVQMVRAQIAQGNISEPSVILSTGEGHALIWLIHQMPRAAETRWRAALQAVIGYLAPFGADPACSDVTRVFRLPESRNEGSGRTVAVIGGTRARYEFDRLADEIYTACGRPTRDQLKERKKERSQAPQASTGRKMPRGLPPPERFRLIREDLEKIRISHGGTVPEGMRNTWLHIFASALAHDPQVGDLRAAVLAAARLGTPELPQAEIEATIRSAEGRSSGDAEPGKGRGRYHYSGATIAERLCVSAEMAKVLELEQILPEEEKRRRKAAKERERRAANGAMSRTDWLAQNRASHDEPWKAARMGKTAYYRRRKDGTLCQPMSE